MVNEAEKTGWIKKHRRILISKMYKVLTSKQRDVMNALLLMANYKENTWFWKGEKYNCKPGQLITSLESIRENCAKDVSIQNIRTGIKKLEFFKFLTNESTNENRLITILNWETYQGLEDETNKDTNKPLTSNQQASNKQLTTNKKERSKEEKKKDKEGDKSPVSKPVKKFKKPTADELRLYAISIGFNSFIPQRFLDYYDSVNWKIGKNPMKNWQAAVRTWKGRSNETKNQTKTPQEIAIERLRNGK